MTEVNPRHDWAVVGGGLLGMTLALRLAEQDKSVTLFESAASLGGLATAWQLGDVTWDRHYHVTLQSDTYLLSLLRELSLEKEMAWKKARTGFYIDSRLHSMSSALEFLRFPPLSLFEKMRLGATIVQASRIRDPRMLEKVPVEDWLNKWSGAGVTQKVWLPLLRAKLGDGYRDASALFIWANIARMYAARNTGSKIELFGYVPGGYARILEKFKELLEQRGVEIRLGQPVRAVSPTGTAKLRVELDQGPSETFSHVVVTTASPLAARICSALRPEEKSRLTQIKHQGIVCASLLLKNSLSPFYITNIADNRMPFTAVIEMSALVDRSHFGGRSLVYLPKYVPSDSPDFNLSDDHVREQFLAGLERMHPTFKRDELMCFQISRVKYLLPVPTINYSANLPKTATSVQGLHIVNSAQIVDGTLNVNESVRLAESAAQQFARPVVAHFPSQCSTNEFIPAHS
jgi:protoporphyrinogen oxidase